MPGAPQPWGAAREGYMMDDPLAALQWHWDEAYLVAHPEPDLWVAVRRDNHETLRAAGPEELRALIIADYANRHVPRDGPLVRIPPLG